MQKKLRPTLMVLVIILLVSLSASALAGCKIQFNIGSDSTNPSDSPASSNPTDTTVSPVTTATTVAPPLLSSDLQYIKHLLTLYKADALALMGNDYVQGPASVDGWMEGYYYASSGLTLCFYPPDTWIEPAEDIDRCIIVYCESLTDANGTHVGMTPNEIMAILGEPTKLFLPSEVTPMRTYIYLIDGIEISYVSMSDDEATTTLYVKFPLVITD